MAIVSVLANGLAMGAVYGLIALGLTLIFGLMRIINFAHGALLMLSMLFSYWVWRICGFNPYLTVVITAPIMFGVGYLCQRLLIKPVLEAKKDVEEPIEVLLLTAALAVVIENLALMVFGADYVMAHSAISNKTFGIGDFTISATRLYALFIAGIVTVCFHLFLKYTEVGRVLRATGQDRAAAALMGINVPHVYGIAFGLGTALLAVAGAVLVPFFYVHPTVGGVFLTKTFVIVVLGGLGSVAGAIAGGLIIGLLETLSAQYMTATLTAVLVYIAFLIVLLVRPSGLFGVKIARGR